MKNNAPEPEFRWIEVVATAGLCAVFAVGMALCINHDIKVGDVLGAGGAVAGAALGAWLVSHAARTAAAASAATQKIERRGFVRDVLTTVSEEVQRGTTADTESALLDFNVSFGENQLRRHLQRTRLALTLAEDCNARIGPDFRALRALHTAIRSLRQTEQHIVETLEGDRAGDYGREAMRFVQTSRNSLRISIDLALRGLDGRDQPDGRFAGLFAGKRGMPSPPARTATLDVDDESSSPRGGAAAIAPAHTSTARESQEPDGEGPS